MLNIENLYTFGCSLTYGSMLEDCRVPYKQLPSKYAWPVVLGKMLNVTVHNLAYPGSSNKQILFTILNTKFLKNSLVVIHWSYVNRYCLLKGPIPRIVQIGPWDSKRDKLNKFFYKDFYDNDDMILDSVFRMNHAKQHLDNLSLLNFHLNVDDIPNFPDWNNVNLVDTNMYRLQRIYDAASDGKHPGPKAHDALAKALYNDIKSKFLQ